MSKIVTGQSTDLEFLKAINDKGANLTTNATPYELAMAIDATGTNVSYDSPNEVVVASVNSEVVPPTPPVSEVPWNMLVPANKLLFREQIVLDFTEEKWVTAWDNFQEEDGTDVYIASETSQYAGRIAVSKIDDSEGEGYPLEIAGLISSSDTDIGHLEFKYSAIVNADENYRQNTVFNLDKENSYYESIEGVKTYFTEAENIVELPKLIQTTGGGSADESNCALIGALVGAIVDENE